MIWVHVGLSWLPGTYNRHLAQFPRSSSWQLNRLFVGGNDIEKKSINEIKYELRKFGLQTSGRKSELVSRLKDHLAVKSGRVPSYSPFENIEPSVEEEEEEEKYLQMYKRYQRYEQNSNEMNQINPMQSSIKYDVNGIGGGEEGLDKNDNVGISSTNDKKSSNSYNTLPQTYDPGADHTNQRYFKTGGGNGSPEYGIPNYQFGYAEDPEYGGIVVLCI